VAHAWRVEAAVRLNRAQLAALAVALAVVVVGKQFYRSASADELQWLLAPVARVVALITGARFTFESGAGWVSRDARFVIAPVCAGLNFALAAFVALVAARLPALRYARSVVVAIAGAAVVAYVATIVVDAVRIALAMWMHAEGDAHQLLGIIVYLGALCVLYALARRRTAHAIAT
jgi:exosortase K